MLPQVLAICAFLSQTQNARHCLFEVLPADGKRLEKPAGKGVELYSWKATDGSMRYSLLWGTNRLKTGAEIKSAACAMADLAQVKAILSRLANGEHVFWMWTSAECADCSYPPRETIEILVAHAKHVGVSLEVDVGDK